MAATSRREMGIRDGRIRGVDFFRVMAILAVISIHTSPFYSELSGQDPFFRYLYLTINHVARFAVPFFFVISGYFWGVQARQSGDPMAATKRMAVRLGCIFLVWSIIYLFPFHVLLSPREMGWWLVGAISWNLEYALQTPMTLLMEGTKVHLWFLVSLLFSVSITAVFVKRQMSKSLLLVAVLLAIFGMLAKSYSVTPLGIALDFNTRNGPFFGLLPFVVGFFLSARGRDLKWFWPGLALFFGGIVLQGVEEYLLRTSFESTPVPGYVFGTFAMGVGVALVALSDHRMFHNRFVCSLGRLTLGVYVSHFIFIDVFRGMDAQLNTPLWEISYVLVVFGLSAALAALLSKNRISRRIVV